MRPPPAPRARARSFERRREVVARDAEAGVEVEPVGVLALGPHAGVEVELRAALAPALLLAPLEQRAAVALAARLRQRGEVVHVERVVPGEVVDDPEPRDGDAAVAVESTHDAVALRPLDLVHAPDERGLVGVLRPERAHGLEGLRRVRREGLSQSFRNDGTSISSSEISREARWRSSSFTSRRRGSRRRPVESSAKSGVRLGRSKPVAITVTRTASPIVSSTTAPKMMFEFWSAAPWMISAASFTSNRPRSVPPVMLRRMPVAPSTDCSSSGLDTAFLAASAERFSPDASPMPMRAEPASCMIVRSSANSMLMRPYFVIMSVMHLTPCPCTASTSRNTSRMLVRRS